MSDAYSDAGRPDHDDLDAEAAKELEFLGDVEIGPHKLRARGHQAALE